MSRNMNCVIQVHAIHSETLVYDEQLSQRFTPDLNDAPGLRTVHIIDWLARGGGLHSDPLVTVDMLEENIDNEIFGRGDPENIWKIRADDWYKKYTAPPKQPKIAGMENILAMNKWVEQELLRRDFVRVGGQWSGGLAYTGDVEELIEQLEEQWKQENTVEEFQPFGGTGFDETSFLKMKF